MNVVEIAAPMAWFAGTVMGIRPMMRRRMLEEICPKCRTSRKCDEHAHRYNVPDRVVRGSVHKRDGFDAFVALWNAAWWPLWMVVGGAALAVVAIGAAGKDLVIWMTPLTGPELDRVIEERRTDIERMSKEINDYKTPAQMREEANLPELVEGEIFRQSITTNGLFCPVCRHTRETHFTMTTSDMGSQTLSVALRCTNCASGVCSMTNKGCSTSSRGHEVMRWLGGYR